MLAPRHTDWICWPTAPKVDVRPSTVPTAFLILISCLSSHPPHSSHFKGLGVLTAHQGGSSLDTFLILFLLPGPLGIGTIVVCPSFPLDTPIQLHIPALGSFLLPHGKVPFGSVSMATLHTCISSLADCFTIICLYICLPNQLLSNLRPETMLYI